MAESWVGLRQLARPSLLRSKLHAKRLKLFLIAVNIAMFWQI